MSREVAMNVKVKDYTNRVIGVVKEKYGLKDKGDALDKFAEMYGDDFVDLEVREDVIRDVINSCDRHFKKYGMRSRSIKDIRKKIEGK